MTTDQLFRFMLRHRAVDPRCHRCGGDSIVMFRDGLERPVCYGCIFTARDQAARFIDGVREAHAEPWEMPEEADEAIIRRLHQLHTVNVRACPLCDDRQSIVHYWHISLRRAESSCWYCDEEEAA